jgi:hypothetical protein
MSYIDYVWLLEKYNGRLRGASNKELKLAKERNPRDPALSVKMAKEYYAKGKRMFMFEEKT